MPDKSTDGPQTWTEWAHDVGDKLDSIDDKMSVMEKKQLEYMNGKFTALKDSVESLRKEHDEHDRKLNDITKRLLDPEDGVVVRTKENARFRKELEALESADTIRSMKRVIARADKLFWGTLASLIIFVTISLAKPIINSMHHNEGQDISKSTTEQVDSTQ